MNLHSTIVLMPNQLVTFSYWYIPVKSDRLTSIDVPFPDWVICPSSLLLPAWVFILFGPGIPPMNRVILELKEQRDTEPETGPAYSCSRAQAQCVLLFYILLDNLIQSLPKSMPNIHNGGFQAEVDQIYSALSRVYAEPPQLHQEGQYGAAKGISERNATHLTTEIKAVWHFLMLKPNAAIPAGIVEHGMRNFFDCPPRVPFCRMLLFTTQVSRSETKVLETRQRIRAVDNLPVCSF